MTQLAAKRVVIVGLFPDVSKSPVTQAGELANILRKNNYKVLTVSRYRNKYIRILSIIFYIIWNRSKFDVAIVQFYSGASLIWQYIAARLVKLFNKKLVFTVHGGGVPARIKVHPNRYLNTLKKGDKITCPSGYLIHELNEYDIGTILIENSIPLNRYSFHKKGKLKPVLLWMRAFTDIYNPEMAIRVVAELKKAYPDVKLYMGGPDMGSMEKIKSMIFELNLQNNIEIVGYMDFKMKEYYAGVCDVYIGTNKVDNAPVTVIEMWAMGLPVVLTSVGGIPYLVDDNNTGLLVNDDDHVGMAQKIQMLIESPGIADRLISNGVKKAANYSEEHVYAKWNELLTSL